MNVAVHKIDKKRFTPYPKYKDSGVEWLGEAPSNWKSKRLKHCVDLINEKVDPEGDETVYVAMENVESWTGRLVRLEIERSPDGLANAFRNDDVLFGKLRPYLAKVMHVHTDGICSSELLVLRPKEIRPHFLFYYMVAEGFISTVDSSTYGAKMPRANWDYIGNLTMLLPTKDEQRTIAAFLDRETTRIDALIMKKQRMIELLQEKRTAIISHAVTKGLNPDAPMQDSGVEWLGEIPEHWELKNLKYTTIKIGSGKTPRGGAETYVTSGVMLLRSQNVHFDGLHLDDVVFIDEHTDTEMKGTRVESHDVLLNITGASIGRCSIAPENLPAANVNQHVCIIRPRKQKIIPELLHALMCSQAVNSQVFALENGTSREGLNFPQVGNLVISIPPESKEQHQIADQIAKRCHTIDSLILKVHEAIEKLDEYRTALISAAVTGKIDVRGEAA